MGCMLGLLYRALDTRRGRALRHAARAVGIVAAPAVLKKYYEHMGLLVTEYAMLSVAPKGVPVAQRWVVPRGIEKLQETIASGRGVIVMTGHIGNFEMTGYALTSGIPLNALYRPQQNRYVDRIARIIRERSGMAIREKMHAMRWSMRVLQSAEGLGALLDQDADAAGVFVPFFGDLASTLTTAPRLAKRTGAAVYPIASFRSRDRMTHELYVGAPIEFASSGDEKRDVLIATRRCNEAIEKMIMLRPGQWLWGSHRWRTRPTPLDEQAWREAAPYALADGQEASK